ncbi:hypothetical protein BB560_004895, partial [Smittium megazygosporum]
SIHTHDSWDNKQCRAAYAHYCSIADEKSRLPILCINSICRAPNSLRRDQSGKNEKKKPRFHCGKCGKHISIADYYTMIMGLTTFESDSQNTSTSGDNEHPKDMRSTDIHHYIESSSINVSPDLRKESIEYDGFNLDFEDNPVVHISSKPIKPSSTVFSGIGSATPSTSEYQQSKKQKTSFAVPSKETSFFLLSKKLAKGKNNTEPLQIENALRSLTGAKPIFSGTLSEQKHGYSRLYLNKIANLQFIGKKTLEFTVVLEYAATFIKKIEELELLSIIPNVDPSVPFDTEASKESKQAVKSAFASQLEKSYQRTSNEKYAAYLKDLALESGVSLEGKQPNSNFTEAKAEMQDSDDSVATVILSPSSEEYSELHQSNMEDWGFDFNLDSSPDTPDISPKSRLLRSFKQ